MLSNQVLRFDISKAFWSSYSEHYKGHQGYKRKRNKSIVYKKCTTWLYITNNDDEDGSVTYQVIQKKGQYIILLKTK